MISGAMIVRDAAATVAHAIASMRPVCDEIVVLDTGSTDSTLAAVEAKARETGCPVRLEHCVWRDDFAAARNEVQSRCRGDWIVVLDADEVLAPGDLRDRIETVPDAIDAVAVRVEAENETGAIHRFWSRRAYRRDRGRWEYPVHNQLCGIHRAVRSTAIVRTSYRGGMAARLARSIPMLEKLHAEQPGDLHAPLYLARTYAAVANWPEARRWAEIGEKCCNGRPGEESLWIVRAQAIFATDGLDAAEEMLARALAIHPDAPDLWHQGVVLSTARWIEKLGQAQHAHCHDLTTENPLDTAEDVARIQDAIDALGLGLIVARTASGAEPAGCSHAGQ